MKATVHSDGGGGSVFLFLLRYCLPAGSLSAHGMMMIKVGSPNRMSSSASNGSLLLEEASSSS